MKRILSILSIITLIVLASCDERDDMRSDIDNLKERVANLEAAVTQLNSDISNYQQMVQGKILVVGYAADKDGNYTIELSNGETVTVYSGKADMNQMPLFSVNDLGHWVYTLNGMTIELKTKDDKPMSALPKEGTDGITPKLKVDANGYWLISTDNGATWSKLGGNQIASGDQITSGAGSLFSNVEIDETTGHITFTLKDPSAPPVTVPIYGKDFHLTIKGTGPFEFGLGQKQEFVVEQANVEKATIETHTWKVRLEETKLIVTAPTTNVQGKKYNDVIYLKIFSKEGYCRVVKLPVTLLTTRSDHYSSTAWQNFKTGTDNVLLDYSYAGYQRGENAPNGAFSLGYTVYNVKERMIAKHLTARQALIDILEEKGMTRVNGVNKLNKDARIVIYFPAGEYVLHNEEDNTYDASQQKDALDSKGNNVSTGIEIYGSNFVIKGDGPDKTRLLMQTPNLPTSVKDTGSSPTLLTIKHTNSPNNESNSPKLASVSQNATRGSFTVQVDRTTGITAGQWVQLRLRSGNSDLVKSEIAPIPLNNSWSIASKPTYMDAKDLYGVKITEFHQVKTTNAQSITFYEPIMHDINVAHNDAGGWEIREYKYLENVGVEDLSFVGNALDGYAHHGDGSSNKDKFGWQYDGAYKPLVINRVVNSWVSNVHFVSVSEALSLSESANSSAYNIRISGTRGHSAVRSQASSRIFIGKVRDESTGVDYKGIACQGQFHGCGVSKPSIGTVLWNVTWGNDACFETHATQPRATLIDQCSGGLVYYRAGGDEDEVPNHLSDLTLWNLRVTGTDEHANDFSWWSSTDKWWKICPPIVVGLHGSTIRFSTTNGRQLSYEESTGTQVTPESLYEAQLYRRLGYVPGWLNALK